jgi:hypothetical protein
VRLDVAHARTPERRSNRDLHPQVDFQVLAQRATRAGENPNLRVPAEKPFSANICLCTLVDCNLTMTTMAIYWW